MSRNYCFTSYKEEIIDVLRDGYRNGIIRRWIGQWERCPTTGTRHFQGYVVFTKPHKIKGDKGAQAILQDPTLHMERRAKDSTEAKAVKYCTKEETRLEPPVSEGDFKTTQGKRTDLDEVKEMIDEGKDELEIADEYFNSWVRNYRAFREYKIMRLGAIRDGSTEMVVRYLWGRSGSGKTRAIFDEYKADNVYMVMRPTNGSLYYDGYKGQEVIVFDDFYGWAPLSHMLNIMDRYPMQLKIHGGMMPMLKTTTTIIFTSNKYWEELYQWPNEEIKSAFRRRISYVREFI